MNGFEIANWITTALLALGLLGTWIKNGREQSKRDQEIADNQKTIIKRLDDPQEGLSAINKRVHSFEVNCATISSSHGERIKAAERDIKEIKSK